MSYPYKCIGSETSTINLPVISGKNIVAVLVDGIGTRVITTTPESDDQVKADQTRGDLTLNYTPTRGLEILVIVKDRAEEGENNDFNEDFIEEDFF